MKQIFGLALACMIAATANAVPKVEFSSAGLEDSKRVVLFVNDVSKLEGLATQVNDMTQGRLSSAISGSDFSAKLGKTQSFYGLTPFTQLVVVGTGDKTLSKAELQNLGGYAVSKLPANGEESVLILTDSVKTDVQVPEAWMAAGASLRDYHFDKYKRASAQTSPRHLVFQSAAENAAKSKFENDLQHMVKGVYLARDMASEPGKSIYPQKFVDQVKMSFKGIKNVDIDVLDVRDMKKHNMGALLGVGQGSIHEPRLLVINYEGADDDEKAPIALVGKGITFDTGGISLKKNDGMWAMKSDLSGAAAVAGTMLAVAARGEKVNLVGLMPLAENMPAEDAIRPGDVLKTMQGTTIEIISTDAEGRLILADAVRYAQDEFKPKMLLNIATLTGSAARALSDEYAAVITRDFALSEQMMQVGKSSGEQVWPLPLHPNHFKQIKSQIADIKNSGVGRPGASIGAAVVGTFVDKGLPWIHLDIAGVDWLDSDIAVSPRGSQGWGVRFMDQLVRDNLQ